MGHTAPSKHRDYSIMGYICSLVVSLVVVARSEGLRCFTCGENSFTPCQEEVKEEVVGTGVEIVRKPGYQGWQGQVMGCNDLLNNRGCVIQIVDGAVIMRGCWLEGAERCLSKGSAEVCTCSTDLCNGARHDMDGVEDAVETARAVMGSVMPEAPAGSGGTHSAVLSTILTLTLLTLTILSQTV